MRVRRSPYLNVECAEGGRLCVHEHLAGNRAIVSRQTLEVLNRFEEVREVPDGQPGLDRLLDLGFLLEEGREMRPVEAKLFSRVLPTMFGCPAWRPGEPADFALLGVAQDGGNLAAPGARYGPDALRQASAIYPMATSSRAAGEAAGLVDHDAGVRILTGARLRDAGEVYLPPGASAEESGRRVTQAVRRLASSGTRPVVMGGDHSLTFAAVRGLLSGPVGILHLDAHSDAAAHCPGLPHHYGNVMSRIIADLGVSTVIHVGVRGLGQAELSQPPCRKAFPPSWLRSHSMGDLLAEIDPNLSWYVSVDIDVVDPAFAPGTATPVAGGLTVPETKALLRAVGQARVCVGCDLVEVNPHFDRNRVTATLGCELLLTLMGGFWRGEP